MQDKDQPINEESSRTFDASPNLENSTGVVLK